MTRFRVAVHIVPRKGVLDPQGKAVSDALQSLGFSAVGDVRVGRHLIIDVSEQTSDSAAATVRTMCDKLLAN
ncbi:MAG: phosphoribosylformylglycinamidine synthase subunit PurS, partial [Gemmatimonadaceae bacterium]